MNPVPADIPGMRRLKVLCTVCLGACIPLFLSVVQEFLFPGPRRPDAVAWVSRVLPATLLVGVVFVMVVAYRIVRYSTLPRMHVVAALLVFIWIVTYLGHIY